MEVPQKVKNRTTKWSNNSTSGNISKGNEDIDSKRYQPPMFTAALFTVAKTQKQPKSPFNGWMDKETVIYIHNGILLRHKKTRKSYYLWQHGWILKALCSVK